MKSKRPTQPERVTESGKPQVVVLGGPNGAGKTTVSRAVLAGNAGISTYVNADVIAQGLAGFDPLSAAVSAGQVLLERLRALRAARASFAYESTLSGRTTARFLHELDADGYEIGLVYVYLPSAQVALARVRSRVRKGGHHIPDDDVIRRFGRSAANFLSLYRPLAHRWILINNGGAGGPTLAASGGRGRAEQVYDHAVWDSLRSIAHEQ